MPRTTIHHLPDDLLARCLAPLPVKDRFVSAALVSKRFHALAARPEQLSLTIDGEGAGASTALCELQALQPWLLKHGASLQELELSCDALGAEAASLLDGCLAAATGRGSGSLRRLELITSCQEGSAFLLGSWASLHSLQQLSIDALQHLALTDCPLEVWLPATAPHLTSLQVLELECSSIEWGEVTDAVNASLQSLPQLRGLWLDADIGGSDAFPTAAALLSSLQWLHLHPNSWSGGSLPAGSWQRSLRRLVLHPGVAAASMQFMEGLPQLDHLSLLWPPNLAGAASERPWRAFFDWAARHPPLRRLDWRLDLDCSESHLSVSPATMNAMVQLGRRRPALCLECLENTRVYKTMFWKELLSDWI
ncbi:hypothetical protein ABPG75_010285 [Micractinium tetrahymenae]